MKLCVNVKVDIVIYFLMFVAISGGAGEGKQKV